MTRLKKLLSMFAFMAACQGLAAAAGEVEGLSADEALDRLVKGNRQYLFTKMSHPLELEGRRVEVAKGQHPFAVILGCADSRVPPEIIFDQGLGDLFVVRVAGNIADDAILGSIEYAVEHLGVRLVVVLGHERCGAVAASVQGGELPGHISALVHSIQPAVDTSKGLPGDAVDNCVRTNATLVANQLRDSAPILAEFVHSGKLKVVAARYDLDSGVVEILPGTEAHAAAVGH